MARKAAEQGIPAAPPVGGSRTLREMEQLARESARDAPSPDEPTPSRRLARRRVKELSDGTEVSTPAVKPAPEPEPEPEKPTIVNEPAR